MLDAKWHQTIHHHTIEFSKNTHPPTTHPHKGFHQQTRFTPSKPPRLRGNSSSLPDLICDPQTRSWRLTRDLATPYRVRKTRSPAVEVRGRSARSPVSTPRLQTLSGLPGRRRGALTRRKLRNRFARVKSPGGHPSRRTSSQVTVFRPATKPPVGRPFSAIPRM